ncbi:hypothetical protein NC652_036904 [Populus alba x Populus x berolinensis]|nr:hypothetical protein NC652_036904 [Populus alba x Populus x berolinensis]
MARFQVIAVAIFITIMLLLSSGMSTAIPKPIQGRKLFQYNFNNGTYPPMNMPTTPGTPPTPATPGTPGTPYTPATPGTPGTPAPAPAIPYTPYTPATPYTPGTPGTPSGYP